jgi:hypothetical protein
VEPCFSWTSRTEIEGMTGPPSLLTPALLPRQPKNKEVLSASCSSEQTITSTESDRRYSSVERTNHFRVAEIVKISTKFGRVLGN